MVTVENRRFGFGEKMFCILQPLQECSDTEKHLLQWGHRAPSSWESINISVLWSVNSLCCFTLQEILEPKFPWEFHQLCHRRDRYVTSSVILPPSPQPGHSRSVGMPPQPGQGGQQGRAPSQGQERRWSQSQPQNSRIPRQRLTLSPCGTSPRRVLRTGTTGTRGATESEPQSPSLSLVWIKQETF